MKNRFIMAAIVAVVAATMSSCHIYKKYELPEEGISKSVVEARQEPVDSLALGNLSWDKVFTDPQLQALIQIALDKNVNLQNAHLNVEMANAQLLGAKLSYVPQLTFSPNAATASYGGSSISKHTWSYQIPVNASWQIDLFGGLLNNKRNAQASVEGAKAYEQAVRTQIVAGVANCYYTLVMLKRQLRLAQETSALWGKSVQTMQDLKEAGRFNEVAVVQSRANYYAIQAQIPALEMNIHEVQNALSLMLNSLPKEWTIDENYQPVFPKYMENGVPMKYLASRPDVVAAEKQFASAYYATNSARAAFYPGLTISAGGGFTNLLGSVIQNPGRWFYQIAASLATPLFRAQNIASLKAAKASQQQALNNFEYTVLSASSEVSDALVAYNKNSQQVALAAEQVKNLEKAVEYNNDLLTLGTTTYLEVLTAQQSLLSAQMSQLQTDLAVQQAAISLYQALGGGR